VVLVAVQGSKYALQFASEALKNDPEVVLVAVRANGHALEHASEALQNDPEVVLAAVRSSGHALQHASPRLKDDVDVVAAAVQQRSSALPFASRRLQDDRYVQQAATNFFDWRDVFRDDATIDGIEWLLENREQIAEEMDLVKQWTPWPESDLYRGEGNEWSVLPFLHTFPATDERQQRWLDTGQQLCPQTARVLKGVPGIRTALFSRKGPQTMLRPHQGWADLANHVLRFHLPLQVPGSAKQGLSGLWVRGEKRSHEEGDLLCFDDSKLHWAMNGHKKIETTVLIFDIVRPFGMPLGGAVRGHTEELDNFVAWFR